MINLLPKKYIKNKAPLAIGIITSILFILGLVIFSVQLFFLSGQIKQAEKTLVFEKQQTAKLTNQVNKLEKSRSLSIKEELMGIKASQYDVNKIMNTFSKTMTDHKINVLSYQLDFLSVDGLDTDGDSREFNEEGKEIMKIDFATEESSLAKLGQCIEAFRDVEWIDDAKFVTTSSNDLYNSTLYMNLLVENLPTLGGK
ncbi:hypothetical protein DOK76_02290 [Vagococcus sp. DIV0080]|uniref:Uncharacterized protein n=1 Tax=Candidatus Vagococcus giribetii TaxID=2230876 RepID=A0ABS3HQ79_9ENTE|nr:hypothetical protein [Vagococcus sp. DIV0080]MBO0475882.1 hypothetical protein [Vagococcus sp. DIV0080]